MIKLLKTLSEIKIVGGNKLPWELFKQKVLSYGLNNLIIPLNAEDEDKEGKRQWTKAINDAEALDDLVDELLSMGYQTWEAYSILINLLVDLPNQRQITADDF